MKQKNQHELKIPLPFVRAGGWIYERCGRKKGRRTDTAIAVRREQIKKNLSMLYPHMNPEVKIKEYFAEKIGLVLLILLLGLVLSALVLVSGIQAKKLKAGGVINRRAHGKGREEIELYAQIGDQKERISFSLEEVQYSKEEIEALFQAAVLELEAVVKGNNLSLDEVRESLILAKSLEDYPFLIEWSLDNYQVLSGSGEIKGERLLEEGTLVKLTAVFRYFDFTGSHQFHVRLYPPAMEEGERVFSKLRESLGERGEAEKTSPVFQLPKEVLGFEVIWREPYQLSSLYLFLAFCAAGIFIYYGRDQDLDKAGARRKQEMLLDYPGIVSKMVLFLRAGMSMRLAFQKMIDGYDRQGHVRYAYEEMKITYYEMQSGIPEQEAYLRFGKRCGVQRYQKLGALIAQGLKKGSKNMLSALETEAEEAFEERKYLVRKLGEEASTKLLLPMSIMLLIVLVIIVLPAFLSFQI